MKSALTIILAGVLLTGLSACGSGHPQASSSQTAPPPVSHTVFAPYVNDVRKAKNVQSVVNAQARTLNKAIRTQTGGATPTSAPAAQSP